MSLTHVHAVFIGAAALLCVLCAVLAFQSLSAQPSITAAASTAVALAGAAGLVRYELRFMRRFGTAARGARARAEGTR
jgi:hypothetical protein